LALDIGRGDVSMFADAKDEFGGGQIAAVKAGRETLE
jgi:hypothetical protein